MLLLEEELMNKTHQSLDPMQEILFAEVLEREETLLFFELVNRPPSHGPSLLLTLVIVLPTCHTMENNLGSRFGRCSTADRQTTPKFKSIFLLGCPVALLASFDGNGTLSTNGPMSNSIPNALMSKSSETEETLSLLPSEFQAISLQATTKLQDTEILLEDPMIEESLDQPSHLDQVEMLFPLNKPPTLPHLPTLHLPIPEEIMEAIVSPIQLSQRT
jgi:hypothetical protein